MKKVRHRTVGRRLGECRNDERNHGERSNHREEGDRALQAVLLLLVAQRPDDDRDADHGVQHDHHHRIDRVARQGRVRIAGQHDGGHDRDLDRDHRQGQDQRAIGLAAILRQRLGMTDHAEGAPDHDAEQDDEQRGGEGEVREIARPAVAEDMNDHGQRKADQHRQFGAQDGDQRPAHGAGFHSVCSSGHEVPGFANRRRPSGTILF
jgi:hypothetical protein